jgi:hypothetical protein
MIEGDETIVYYYHHTDKEKKVVWMLCGYDTLVVGPFDKPKNKKRAAIKPLSRHIGPLAEFS